MRFYSIKEVLQLPNVSEDTKKTLRKDVFRNFDGYIGEYVVVTSTSGKKIRGKLIGIGKRNTFFYVYEIKNDNISMAMISIYFLAALELWKDASRDDKIILDKFIEEEFGPVELPQVK